MGNVVQTSDGELHISSFTRRCVAGIADLFVFIAVMGLVSIAFTIILNNFSNIYFPMHYLFVVSAIISYFFVFRVFTKARSIGS